MLKKAQRIDSHFIFLNTDQAKHCCGAPTARSFRLAVRSMAKHLLVRTICLSLDGIWIQNHNLASHCDTKSLFAFRSSASCVCNRPYHNMGMLDDFDMDIFFHRRKFFFSLALTKQLHRHWCRIIRLIQTQNRRLL